MLGLRLKHRQGKLRRRTRYPATQFVVCSGRRIKWESGRARVLRQKSGLPLTFRSMSRVSPRTLCLFKSIFDFQPLDQLWVMSGLASAGQSVASPRIAAVTTIIITITITITIIIIIIIIIINNIAIYYHFPSSHCMQGIISEKEMEELLHLIKHGLDHWEELMKKQARS